MFFVVEWCSCSWLLVGWLAGWLSLLLLLLCCWKQPLISSATISMIVWFGLGAWAWQYMSEDIKTWNEPDPQTTCGHSVSERIVQWWWIYSRFLFFLQQMGHLLDSAWQGNCTFTNGNHTSNLHFFHHTLYWLYRGCPFTKYWWTVPELICRRTFEDFWRVVLIQTIVNLASSYVIFASTIAFLLQVILYLWSDQLQQIILYLLMY